MSTPISFNPKAASPAISIEEITPRPKRAHGGDKGKSKVDSNVWDDAAIAMGRAHNVITPDELKSLSVVPLYELVNPHVHKLIQVLFCPNLLSLHLSLFLGLILVMFIFN